MKKANLFRPGGRWHLVLIAAIFVYALVVELLSRFPSFEGVLFQSDIARMPRVVFIVMGLVNLAISFILLARPHLLRTMGGFGPLIATWGVAVATFMPVYALLESIAIYGMMLFVLTEDRLDFYGFALTSLVAMLLLWTQRGRWDRLIALEQA